MARFIILGLLILLYLSPGSYSLIAEPAPSTGTVSNQVPAQAVQPGVQNIPGEADALQEAISQRNFQKIYDLVKSETLVSPAHLEMTASMPLLKEFLSDAYGRAHPEFKYPPAPDAQEQLGMVFFKGNGLSASDKAEAFKWLSRAADAGKTKATEYLGILYYQGEGVPQDYIKSMRIFMPLAQRESQIAQYYVGEQIYNGQGCAADERQGCQWHVKAAQAGYEPSKKRLEELAGLGSPSAQEALRILNGETTAQSLGSDMDQKSSSQKKKAQEPMPDAPMIVIIPLLLIFVVLLIALLWSFIYILILAFRKSLLWGLAVFFIPFAGLVFVILNWEDCRKPFLIGLLCGIIPLLAAIAVPNFLRARQKAMENRAKKEAKKAVYQMPATLFYFS